GRRVVRAAAGAGRRQVAGPPRGAAHPGPCRPARLPDPRVPLAAGSVTRTAGREGGGERGPGPGRVAAAPGRPGPLPRRRRTVSARRLGAGLERLRPRPRPAARPFLGAVLPRRLSPESAALACVEAGPD